MRRSLACARNGSLVLLLIGIAQSGRGNPTGGHANLTCADCHIAHTKGTADDSREALWSTANTADGLPTFTLYSSPTFDALGTDISQPDGASRLCLGCHDGTYRGPAASLGRRVVFGTSALAGSHPISFTYDSALAARVPHGALHDPSSASSGLGGTVAQDLLDANGKMQCTSCHNVHGTGRGPSHLRYDYDRRTHSSQLCRVCHSR